MSTVPSWLQGGLLGYLDSIMPIVLLHRDHTFDHWDNYKAVIFGTAIVVFWLLLIGHTAKEIRAYLKGKPFFVVRQWDLVVPWNIRDEYIHSAVVNSSMLIFNQLMIVIHSIAISLIWMFAVTIISGCLYQLGWVAALVLSFLIWPAAIANLLKYKWQAHLWFKNLNQ